MEEPEPGCEEMTALFLEGARLSGSTPEQAAVHLLVFTDAPRRMAFDRNRHLIQIRESWDPSAQAMVTGAGVSNWGLLPTDRGLALSSADRRMIRIAASITDGCGVVDLNEELRNMGWAHARRVAEAVLIRTGMTRLLTVAGTPQLAELQAFQAELSGGPS
jgi:hypothetical protein